MCDMSVCHAVISGVEVSTWNGRTRCGDWRRERYVDWVSTLDLSQTLW